MGMKSEIEEALQAHAAWREHFKDILYGRAPFDLKSIGAPDQCVLGKWLMNEGHRMIPSELHDDICEVHAEFHHIAADIIQKIKDKRYVEAKKDHCCPVKLMSESLQANTDGAYSEINCVPDLNAQLLFWQSSGFCSTGGFDVSWQNPVRSTYGLPPLEDIPPNCRPLRRRPLREIAHLRRTIPRDGRSA